MDDPEKLYDRAAELVRKASGASSREERMRLLREAKAVGLRAAQLARSRICPKYGLFFGQEASMRGASLDLKQRILDRVGPPGARVWTPVDFLDLGGRAAIDKALQRLVADGDLRRIDRGLYDRPAVNKLTKAPAAPSTQGVIDAITRRDQARLLLDGMTAANDLGLTTAVPAQVVVLTDARLKPVQLGAQQIRFKQAAPSRLYWAGRPAMRVVQALFWLHDVLPSDRDAILRRLRNLIVQDPKGAAIATDLRAGLSAMPIWMQSIARDLVAQAHDAGVPTL